MSLQTSEKLTVNCPSCSSTECEYHADSDTHTCTCGWMWSEEITFFNHWPDCPMCGVRLVLLDWSYLNQNNWHCANCEIVLTAEDILLCLNEQRVNKSKEQSNVCL